jgi:hypothetical protein
VAKPVIARGVGPVPVRIGLAGLALVYFVMLLKHPEPKGWIRQIAYFSECTGLFTQADTVATEYRLAGWSCERKAWEPLDPRPYFPMRADDKEARFQRLGHFYRGDVKVLHALGEYIVNHHTAGGMDDGFAGPLGGIQMYKLDWPIPAPGTEIGRYEYVPMSPQPAGTKRSEVFESSPRSLRDRCKSSGGATSSAADTRDAIAPTSGSDPWSTP